MLLSLYIYIYIKYAPSLQVEHCLGFAGEHLTEYIYIFIYLYIYISSFYFSLGAVFMFISQVIGSIPYPYY